MAAFLALRSVCRKQKQCRHENPLQRPENELIYEYRLNKAAIMELCDLLREDLKPALCSLRVLTVEPQVLISLKLLASGSFQSSAKNNINVAQSTVSCTLSRFMDSLLSKNKEFMYMPDSVYAEKIKLQFYLLGRFPRVIGAIDGTHIPIIALDSYSHKIKTKKLKDYVFLSASTCSVSKVQKNPRRILLFSQLFDAYSHFCVKS